MLYRFGPFQFDPQARLLYRADERIALTPKAADLLLVLLQHERQLIGKDELLRRVWPDTFVEDGNLSKHIFFLRKTLGEKGEGAAYIETVPKRGYRFIGLVERAAEDGGSAIEVEEGTREQALPAGPRTRRTVLLFASLAILLAAGLAWATWARKTADPQLRSLLVLPFANLGPQADNDYFSDGLAEELIAAFSGVKGLRVIPRTTAFQFKGKSGDVRAIGRQLGVQAVLDGGVERDGEHLRIRLALTRVSDGQTLWSHSYDRAAQDIFATEDEVATNVVHALFPKDQRSVDLLPLNGTKSIEAQNLCLKGHFVQQALYNNADALALFQKAAQLDPTYPQAWAGQAFCYLQLGHGYQRYPKDVLPLAVQAVQRALQLNPRMALSHAILGYLDVAYLRDWEAARREIETAISLDPNNGESHHWMSHYWVSLGQFKEAEDESRRALECDPLNFGIASHQAWVKYEQGLFPEAIHAAEETLRLQPAHGPTSWYQMRAYEESGQLTEAIAVRRRLGWKLIADELELSFRQNGAAGYWRALKENLIRKRSAGPGLVRPTDIAWAYAHLGERERALEWLDRAVEERDPWTMYMKVEPPFAALRSDPRFQSIARAAGIPW